MEYKEIKLIKQSEKSTVHLVQESGGEQVFIRKVLKGRHAVYSVLQDCPNPYLPKIYEVVLSDSSTTILEEYIEGESVSGGKLSEKQFLQLVRELCSVLDFLHEKSIIHRDIKPSNIIIAKDGHIRLLDFDAARMKKESLEQDTVLLGTRGYAPPEQYGFAQTDERSDIYALGVTLQQILGEKAKKRRYQKIIRKCTAVDMDKRYRSALQVKKAFFLSERKAVLFLTVFLLTAFIGIPASYRVLRYEETKGGNESFTVLPTPKDPHWDKETGYGLWGNVPESGYEDNVEYKWRLYRRDTAEAPDTDDTDWLCEGVQSGNLLDEDAYFMDIFAVRFQENGFYYFAVSSSGDGIHYTDSPYVMSDAFEYIGESAPTLPAPTGLDWKLIESEEGRKIYATWSNLDDYADTDCFNVCIYDKSGAYVMNNIWTKELIMERGQGGIQIRREFIADKEEGYRFTVQAMTSRPNEYRSSLMPDPVPEECYSPWYYPDR